MTKPLSLELIEWYDHWGAASVGWSDWPEETDLIPMNIKSVGYVTGESKQMVHLTSHLGHNIKNEPINGSGHIAILKKCIISRTKLD